MNSNSKYRQLKEALEVEAAKIRDEFRNNTTVGDFVMYEGQLGVLTNNDYTERLFITPLMPLFEGTYKVEPIKITEDMIPDIEMVTDPNDVCKYFMDRAIAYSAQYKDIPF